MLSIVYIISTITFTFFTWQGPVITQVRTAAVEHVLNRNIEH